MKFKEPEVIEMGLADELIQDIDDIQNSEGTMPSRFRTVVAMYIADEE